VLGDMKSRAGICKESPRGKDGLRGVVGLSSSPSPRPLSSFDFLFSGSRNLGDGDRVGGPPSDRDLTFDGDREAVRRWGVPGSFSTLRLLSSASIGSSF
jgi:hypothetical protein